MSGHYSWSTLRKSFSPEMRRRVDEAKRVLKAEMPLHELRRALALARRDVVEGLNGGQP